MLARTLCSNEAEASPSTQHCQDRTDLSQKEGIILATIHISLLHPESILKVSFLPLRSCQPREYPSS